MVNPDWQYSETLQKKIRITAVNLKERHIDAVDMDGMIPFCLDAGQKINVDKIKKAKIYQVTIKVFQAPLTGELERELREFAITDHKLRHSLAAIKESGGNLKKFELTSIKK